MRVHFFAFSVLRLCSPVLALLLIAQAHQAGARPTFINQFRSLYPASLTGQARCATCHAKASGGPPWNSYGRDLLANGGRVGSGGDITSALSAVELLNSDSIAGNNATEIQASTQPGWCETSTTGCNNQIYNADGSNAGTGIPPDGQLDDEPLPETPPSDGAVDLSGDVENASGKGLCAMVLASGKFQFSCNPDGPFSLTNLPREGNGTVKRQVYVDGSFPNVEVLQGSVNETVVMAAAGSCPNYNEPYSPGVSPGDAGKRINISGTILIGNSGTPVCAMVLANGAFEFSCNSSGTYSINIPLDNNGQFKLQVYADGFAPITQKFDDSSVMNDVRLARASECN
jgi:hypothetical protein